MEEISLSARRRRGSGKGGAHRVRAAGNVPGVFYLGHKINIPFELNAHELQLALRKRPKLLRLKLDDGSEHECVVREVQYDPVSGRYQHLDLMGIVSGQKVTVRVEVELLGSPHGVRLQGGVLQQSVHQLHIECLPSDIPEKVSLDVNELKVGSSIHVRDLHVEHFRILDDPETTIVSVLAPKIEKAPEVAEEVKPEEGEAAAAEGEVAAETEEKEKKEKDRDKDKDKDKDKARERKEK